MSDAPHTDLIEASNARIGTLLRGKYRIDRVLGVGGMAVVYSATHRNRAQFAIKILHPELAVRSDIRRRFLLEGYVANSVKHPGAVAVVDDDIAEDGAPFLVMEMLHGATVESLCRARGGRLSVAVTLAMAGQLLEVLSSAHANGIVHRDIKPANIFVTTDGSVKVLDFGIARLREAQGMQTSGTGSLFGTPGFMSPEQATGRSEDVDALTDLWAVAATLFWLLSGSLVHEGVTASMLLIQAATVRARSLASVNDSVPEKVVALVDRALLLDKSSRWQDAAEMQRAVRQAFVALVGSRTEKEVLAALLAGPPDPPLNVTIRSQERPAGTKTHPLLSEMETTSAPRSRGTGSLPAVASTNEPDIASLVSAPTVAAFPTEREAVVDITPPHRPRMRLGGRWRAAGGFVLFAAISVSAWALRPHRSAEIGAAIAPPQQLPVLSSVVAPADSVPEVHPLPPALVVSAAKAVATTPAPLRSDSAPSSPPRRKPGNPAASASAPAAVTPARKPDCEPNYYIDANGAKHFKAECF